MFLPTDKIVITGAAGLVGQNLILVLRERGYRNLVAIDKRASNIRILRELNPDLQVIETDLAQAGDWADLFQDAKVVIQLHAQIGGDSYSDFEANNITATRYVLTACKRNKVPKIIHISSSVVNSMAIDYYTETKKEQAKLVEQAGIPYTTLSPTLMFGWFDRKHLGWLSRFMKKLPIFPVPGDGNYVRQPLFVRDFCSIILACLERDAKNETFNISGQEKINYIDIIKAIKHAVRSSAYILHIPFKVFWVLLWIYGRLDPDPPFTTRQLQALVLPETFEVIPWGQIFGVKPTPFSEAVIETYADRRYGTIVLEF